MKPRGGLTIRPVDCVVVVGRGVEKVAIRNSNNNTHDIWKVTRYIQKLDAKGQRTGRREHVAPDDEQAWIGGGKANIIATVELFRRLKKMGTSPKLFIVSGGRPAYLENEPEGFCEAIPMLANLKRWLPDLPKTIIQNQTRNTKDDVLTSMQNAISQDCHSIALVNTRVAMPRTQAFYRLLSSQSPELAKLQITFYTAEDLLLARYSTNHTAATAFRRIWTTLKKTGAWKNTTQTEKGGILAIRTGKYGGRGNY